MRAKEARMRNFEVAQLKTSSAIIISRELALAADRSLWADNRSECVTIVAQIYDLFDDLEHGLDYPNLRNRVLAAETAAWVGNMSRCASLLGVVGI